MFVNTLYYGDNLDVLRQHVKDETVDLVYLDPPFNSNQDYNVLFAEHGTRAAAQIKAFEDTWTWDEGAARSYEEVVERTGGRVADAMRAFRTFLGTNDMLAYGPEIEKTYRVIGEPTSIEDAEELAKTDPYQFQWWALGLVGARPVEQKKGADKGIDGRLFFHDEGSAGKTKQAIISVKAGALHATYVQGLAGVVALEKAAIGILISFDEPTKPMRAAAASAGFYDSPWGKHPKIQLVTVAELLGGKKIDVPRTRETFKQAPKAYAERENLELLAAEPPTKYGWKPKKST